MEDNYFAKFNISVQDYVDSLRNKNTKEKNRARRKTTENLFGISKRRTITLQNVYPTHKVDKDLAKCVHSVRRKDRGDQRKKEKRPIYNLQISPWRFYEEALFSIICSGMLKTHTHRPVQPLELVTR